MTPTAPVAETRSWLPLRLRPRHATQQPSVDADIGGNEAHERIHPGQPAGDDQLVALGDRGVDPDAVGARKRCGVDAETAGGLENSLALGRRDTSRSRSRRARSAGRVKRGVGDLQHLPNPDELRARPCGWRRGAPQQSCRDGRRCLMRCRLGERCTSSRKRRRGWWPQRSRRARQRQDETLSASGSSCSGTLGEKREPRRPAATNAA